MLVGKAREGVGPVDDVSFGCRVRGQGEGTGALLAFDVAEDAGNTHRVTSPFDRRQTVGSVQWTSKEQAAKALDAAWEAFPRWDATPVAERAAIIRRLGDLMEEHMAELMTLCSREGGKLLTDGVDEIKEAVDFCRYYAMRAEESFGAPIELPGPTGERNSYGIRPRAAVACMAQQHAEYVHQLITVLACDGRVLWPEREALIPLWHSLPHSVQAGTVNGWFLVGPGNIASLGQSTYGLLLIAKLLLFAGMLGLAALNRYRLTPALAQAIEEEDAPRAQALLRASLVVEGGLAIVILGLVAWLGTLSPPMSM